MAITAKELMSPPRFEAVGLFVAAHPANGDWSATYEFNCLGFNIRINVEDDAVQNSPVKDTIFHIVGSVRMNSRNGSVFLVPESKRVVSDLSSLSSTLVAAGVLINAAGHVDRRVSTTFNRQTFMKATLAWGGGQKEFKSLTPEVFQRVPREGLYGRFVFGIHTVSEKSVTGQTVTLQFLTLLDATADVLEGSSLGLSSAASSVSGAPSVKPGVPLGSGAKG